MIIIVCKRSSLFNARRGEVAHLAPPKWRPCVSLKWEAKFNISTSGTLLFISRSRKRKRKYFITQFGCGKQVENIVSVRKHENSASLKVKQIVVLCICAYASIAVSEGFTTFLPLHLGREQQQIKLAVLKKGVSPFIIGHMLFSLYLDTFVLRPCSKRISFKKPRFRY